MNSYAFATQRLHNNGTYKSCTKTSEFMNIDIHDTRIFISGYCLVVLCMGQTDVVMCVSTKMYECYCTLLGSCIASASLAE